MSTSGFVLHLLLAKSMRNKVIHVIIFGFVMIVMI